MQRDLVSYIFKQKQVKLLALLGALYSKMRCEDNGNARSPRKQTKNDDHVNFRSVPLPTSPDVLVFTYISNNVDTLKSKVLVIQGLCMYKPAMLSSPWSKFMHLIDILPLQGWIMPSQTSQAPPFTPRSVYS